MRASDEQMKAACAKLHQAASRRTLGIRVRRADCTADASRHAMHAAPQAERDAAPP